MIQGFTYSFRSGNVATGTSADKVLAYIKAPTNMHAFMKRLEAYAMGTASDDAYEIGLRLVTGTASGGDTRVLSPPNSEAPVFVAGLGGIFLCNEGTAITGLTLVGEVFAPSRGNKMDVPSWVGLDEGEYPKIKMATGAAIVLIKPPASTLTLNISGSFELV